LACRAQRPACPGVAPLMEQRAAYHTARLPEREEAVQQTIRDGLTLMGYIVLSTSVRRVRYGYGTSPGVPDLLVTRPGWGVTARFGGEDAHGPGQPRTAAPGGDGRSPHRAQPRGRDYRRQRLRAGHAVPSGLMEGCWRRGHYHVTRTSQ